MTNAEKLDLLLELMKQRVASSAEPEILRRLGGIEELLKEQNGRQRQQGEVLAAHCQWIEIHDKQVHEALSARVEAANSKANVMGGLNLTLTSALAAVVAIFKGGK